MPGKALHYPHSTIESTGASLNGHAESLHSTASSVSGVSLPSDSLGSLGTGHAGMLQSHISGLSSHISAIAERERNNGGRLIENSTDMRNTDDDHAGAFRSISKTNVDFGKLPKTTSRTLTPAEEKALQDKRNRVNAANGGATRIPTDDLRKAGGDGLTNVPEDTSFPSRPQQPAPPATPVPVPGESHNHTTHGDFKPGKGSKPGKTTGGHVATTDITGAPRPNSFPAPPKPPVHGNGVNVGAAGGLTPAAVGTNGVYTVNHAPLAGVPHGPGTGNNKPMSTMFPQGVNSGQVQNMGNQAWNSGAPMHGTHLPNASGPGNNTWAGQAQVPYTPVWNPGGADHGSGAGNSDNAGQVVNIQGFHRPMNPGSPTEYPATYFPQPPAQQPPVPNDTSWQETGPKRTYDDPNYPGM